jgi:heat shock protein HslJ
MEENMHKKNKGTTNKLGKIYVLGLILVCGFLLTSVDDCENMEFAEQQYAREQAALAGQQKTKTGSGSSGTQAVASNATASGSQSETEASASGTGSQPASGTETASGTQDQAGETTPAGTQPVVTGSTGSNYVTSIFGKTWKLTELHFSDKTVVLNRGELSADQADIFTLAMDNASVSGKAAPNRYFGPYQAGANNALSFQPLATTMMAAIFTDPQKITEPEYLQYLGKVKSWKINQNKLELTGTDAANKPLTMVFSN